MKDRIGLIVFVILAMLFSLASLPTAGNEFDPSPPDETQKLVFIHHSCGENWLGDDNGGLGQALGENNYFVSDTNYGWGPNGIGDATDIPDWLRWFRSEETPQITEALYNEFSNNWYGWEYYQRPIADPGGENEIIMFKSCYPNSELWGDPDDAPGFEADWTVAGAKFVYNEILHYFSQHPDKLFVVITAPPNLNKETGENARAFNQWLVNDWLMPYTGTNVAVWDFYAVLSHKNNHHRFVNDVVEHISTNGNGTAAYDTWGDPHPSTKGNEKATDEFIPMLNIYVNRWLSGLPAHVFPNGFEPEFGEEQTEVEEEEVPTPAEAAPEEITAQDELIFGTEGLIDNFDGENHWEAFTGEKATITCQQTRRVPISEPYALEIITTVPASDWASCEYYFDEPQDFNGSEGLLFQLYSDTQDFPFSILLYSGNPDSPELYASSHVTIPAQFQEWQPVAIPWTSFNPVWNENVELDLTRVEGIAFSFGTDHNINGTIAIEDLTTGSLSVPEQELVDTEALSQDESSTNDDSYSEDEGSDNQIMAIREQICGGIFLIPLLFLCVSFLKRKFA